MILYSDTETIGYVCERWKTDLECDGIIEAEFPPTHAFVEFYPVSNELGDCHLQSVCDALSKFNDELRRQNPVDVSVSILLDPGDGFTILPVLIKRISELGANLLINCTKAELNS